MHSCRPRGYNAVSASQPVSSMSEQASSETVPQRHLSFVRFSAPMWDWCARKIRTSGSTRRRRREASHPGGRLLIVADGMGGHRGGATASRLAAETVKAQYLGSETHGHPDRAARIADPGECAHLLRGAVQSRAAGHGHHDLRARREERRGLARARRRLAHLPRARRRDPAAHRRSLARGDDGPRGPAHAQEAETHPRRNVLQRSMGVAEDVEIDVRGPIELREGDTFILCSDGLHGVVKEDELQGDRGASRSKRRPTSSSGGARARRAGQRDGDRGPRRARRG